MPKSDTWPGGVAMESLSNMDSAGSCDSVISMNSGISEDTLGHLSAEEKACLMYLEETIEALKVQEDSGLSSDEPDSGQSAAKMTQYSSAMRVDDVSDESGRGQKSFLRYGVPTPLLPANGVTTLPLRAPAGITEPKTPEVPTEPATKALTIGYKAEQQTLNQASEPQTTVDASDSKPALATNTKDLEMSIDFKTQPEAPVTDSKCPLSVTQTEMLHSATDGDNTRRKSVRSITKVYQGHSIGASEINIGLIPPPSDFMDKPKPHPEPEEECPLSAGTSARSPLVHCVEGLHRFSVKKTPVSSIVTQATTSGALPSPLPEAAEPRSPPSVAPKPKKLPSNIIFKSHRASVAGSDGNVGHSVSATGDRLVLDPQRARMEALRKLGLLKSDEADSGPALSPNLSPMSRRSWAYPSPPISPAPPCTSSPALVSSSAPAFAPVPSISAIQAPNILPAPDAFSNSIKPLSHTGLSSVSEPTAHIGAKSATLERFGMGLSSYMDSQEFSEASQDVSAECSPSQLRNNRPRPASLGSGKDFSSGNGEGLQLGQPTNKGPDTRLSLPAPTVFQHTGVSQKLPRAHGISVLISPRAKNGEDRREALKKLGLLRD